MTDDNFDEDNSNSCSTTPLQQTNDASSPHREGFTAQFDALLADILTGEPIAALEEEIAGLKGQIAAALRRHQITPEHLQRRYQKLLEVKGRLKEGQVRLEGFLTAPEVAEIEAARQAALEQRAKAERVARFDEYFEAVGELSGRLEQIRERFGFGAPQQKMTEAKEALLQAKALLRKISLMKGGLFPQTKTVPGNLLKDFELVLAKLTADVEEWTAVLMPPPSSDDAGGSSPSSKAEDKSEEWQAGNPHQAFVIRTKRILASSSESSSSLTTELISSEEVLASFKPAQSSGNSKISRLPPLKISRFMVEIKDVIEEMSALFSTSSSSSSSSSESSSTSNLLLTETFADVCELFLSTSPYLFRAKIEPRDPRRSAVAHNNCVFFAHLIEVVAGQTPPLKAFLAKDAATTNYVSALRELASAIFRAQMQFEEGRLLSVITGETPSAQAFASALAEIANETPATELKVSSVAHYELRRALNDCLGLLGALREAFAGDLLPEKLAARAFSTLVTSLLTAFLAPIIELNDISSLGASHLAHELDYFSGELQPFLAGSGGGASVSKWIKLNEVNFILKSSLLEIVNRWADGSGLLASYLTAEEVKHLVRALFQNTERRSKALAKIK